jgi:malate dehydrogenase (oxaloacetate-decarboxylating)(NADP+)
MMTAKHGIPLLQDPSLNKSTAFTDAEKRALGLVGLVPDVTESGDLQLRRACSCNSVTRPPTSIATST